VAKIMNKKTFSIKTFNPYEYKFPNRKVLTAAEIHIVKELRHSGYEVSILPDDSRHVDYLFRKGYQSIFDLAWPFILTIWNELPKEIVLSLISGWYISTFFRGEKTKTIPRNVSDNIVLIENFSGNMYNLNGDSVRPEEVAKKLSDIADLQSLYKRSFVQKSAYEDLPVPIYREHSPLIVGWARVSIDDTGMHIDESIITDDQAWKDVKSKKLKGFSAAGIATKSTCNICNTSYVTCEHISGNEYDGVACFNTIEKALLAECSLVEIPSQSECLVEIITNQLSL
jgi:hypothetical protein